MNLTELANKYKTDKGTEHSRGNGAHGYTGFYQSLFQHMQDRPLKLLEIGAAEGASLRMWRDFFPNAQIFGIDINPRPVEGCTVLNCNQSNVIALNALAEKHGPFDIVLDDGSHKTEDQMASFVTLFPVHMTKGGLYVIEDLTDAQRDVFELLQLDTDLAGFTSTTGWHVLVWLK